VTVLWFFGAVSGSADDQPPADDPQTEFANGEDGSSSSSDHAGEEQGGGDRESDSKNSSKPKRKTYLVVHVVDGDTVDLANGRTVRLGGIDAPEVGECGYKRARNRLEGLVLGQRVSLGKTDEDHDRYGRLLRYVDVGDTDAGLRLIKEGLAIARYDSRDGYGFHPREPKYIKADRASPAFTCAPKAVPFVAQPKPQKNCAPGYSPCIRPYPPDLDCPDIGHPVQVTGSDPHGLDRDGDGVACEWG
jgi:endonuclease YncB( thermonuclease family)